MNCPKCATTMRQMTLDGYMGKSVTIDACVECQTFWFDMFESVRLSAASTLKLMKFIGENTSKARPQLVGVLRCPTCKGKLIFANDRQRNTRFTYWRCEQDHGRLIGFLDFLREKDFIRPLSPQQIADLRKTVQTVNCSSCGASVNIQTDAVCEYCHSPLSMLDMKQPERLLAQLKAASAHRADATDPNLQVELAKARMDGEYSFAANHEPGESRWWDEAQSTGLVEAGLTAVAKWMTKSGI
jgi:ssDNA-binding Zn-finger/Zn-ribbon topoisomerase 1